MTVPAHKQSDGRKPLPHIVTALVSIAASLVAAGVFHLGAKGPAGTTTVVNKPAVVGVCAYFGPDANGTKRFQLSTPGAGGTCTRGIFVSGVPGQ